MALDGPGGIRGTLSGMDVKPTAQATWEQHMKQLEDEIAATPPPPQMPMPQTPPLWQLALASLASNIGSSLSRNAVYSAANARWLEDVRQEPQRIQAENLAVQMEDSKQRRKQLMDLRFQQLDMLQREAEREQDYKRSLQLEVEKDKLLQNRQRLQDEEDRKEIVLRGEESRKTKRVVPGKNPTTGGAAKGTTKKPAGYTLTPDIPYGGAPFRKERQPDSVIREHRARVERDRKAAIADIKARGADALRKYKDNEKAMANVRNQMRAAIDELNKQFDAERDNF